MNKQILEGLSQIKDGIVNLSCGLWHETCRFSRFCWKWFDYGAHTFPYVYIFLILISCFIYSYITIGNARIERDQVNVKLYQLEKKTEYYKFYYDSIRSKKPEIQNN